MPVAITFDEVLLVAVNYFVEHGYTDHQKLAYWMERLEKAARREMLSTTQLNERLKYALNAEFIRLVERGLLLNHHPGINRSTLIKIRPQLRTVLTNRISAAITLIRIAREEEIANTLRRFSGWASSLPPTSSPSARQADVRRAIRTTLTQAARREQRILRDQVRKLGANLSATTGQAAGAIAAIWVSNWHKSDYDYREAHRDLALISEVNPFLIRNSWAHKQGLLNTVGARFTDQLEHQPGQMASCKCHYDYIYNIGDLPSNLVNRKAA